MGDAHLIIAGSGASPMFFISECLPFAAILSTCIHLAGLFVVVAVAVVAVGDFAVGAEVNGTGGTI